MNSFESRVSAFHWPAGAGGGVGRVDDAHQGNGLAGSIERGLAAFQGMDEIRRATGAAHSFVGKHDDAAIDRPPVLLTVEYAGVDRRAIKAIGPEESLDEPPALVPWKVTDTSSRLTISAQEIWSVMTCPVLHLTMPWQAFPTSVMPLATSGMPQGP